MNDDPARPATEPTDPLEALDTFGRRTIGELIARAAERFADDEYVIAGDERLTYRELDRRSRRLAASLLRSGVGKSTRVGILMSEGPGWTVAWAAISRLGAVVVPVSTMAKADELARAVRHPDLHGVIVGPEATGIDLAERLAAALVLEPASPPELATALAPYLRWIGVVDAVPEQPWLTRLDTQRVDPRHEELVDAAAAEVHPSDIAVIIYSSGTTAAPKGVIHTHDTVVTKAFHLAHYFGFAPSDRTCALVPWFWVGGLVVTLLPSLVVGAAVVVVHRFVPEALLAVLEREGVTRVLLAQHQIADVLASPEYATTDLSSITDGVPGIGTTLSDPTRWLPSMGMTESFGMYSWGRAEARSWGIPIMTVEPGMELVVRAADGTEIVDGETGEIWLRGRTVMAGLYKLMRADVFDADGWFATGDLVRRDGDSYHFAGRRNTMIKCRGASVSPGEVEALLVGHDDIAAAYVVGIPDGDRGHQIGAAVVARPGAAIEPRAVREWAAERISAFKVPTVVAIIEDDDVPRTPTNKVRLPDLADLIAARGDADARH